VASGEVGITFGKNVLLVTGCANKIRTLKSPRPMKISCLNFISCSFKISDNLF